MFLFLRNIQRGSTKLVLGTQGATSPRINYGVEDDGIAVFGGQVYQVRLSGKQPQKAHKSIQGYRLGRSRGCGYWFGAGALVIDVRFTLRSIGFEDALSMSKRWAMCAVHEQAAHDAHGRVPALQWPIEQNPTRYRRQERLEHRPVG